MGEWKSCTLSSLGTIVGGATPSTKKPENYEGGTIPWITPKDLSGFSGRYISHGERNITEKGLNSCSAQMMPKHSVLFSSRAPIGYVAISDCEVCTNQGFKSIVPNENADYLFLYYLLQYKKKDIENLGSGTTFKEVSANTMKSVEVRIPAEKSEQIRIARVLSAIDDKIEANTRINENLQHQIEAIFNDKYAPSLHLSNWTIGTIGDVVTLQRGYDLPKDKMVSGSYPVAGSTDTIFYHNDYTTEAPCVVMGRSGNIGKPRLYMERCWAHNTTLFVKDFKGNNPYWSYYMLRAIDYTQFQGGSAVPTLNRNHVHSYEIAIPPIEQQNEFAEQIHPLLLLIENNKAELSALTDLRDTILPQLMSGELNISDLNI